MECLNTTKDFTTMTKLIRNDEYINLMIKYLTNIDPGLATQINARCLLSSFLIAKFPDDLLHRRMMPIYWASKDISSKLSANYNIESSRLIKYFKLHNEWRQYDLDHIVYGLLHQYFDLYLVRQKISADDPDVLDTNGISIDMVTSQMSIIEDRLFAFHKSYMIANLLEEHNGAVRSILTNLKLKMITGFEDHGEGDQTRLIMKSAFWDSKPDIIPLIDHFAELLQSLNPHFNYREKYDSKYICQMVTNDSRELSQFVISAFNDVRELDSDDGRHQIDEWLSYWNEINNWDYDWREIIHDVIRDLINHIEIVVWMTRQCIRSATTTM